MSSAQSTSKVLATEPKARGANRSTKVAGKLKVLPEQPESVAPHEKANTELKPPPKVKVLAEGEDSVTAGDSDEDDVADDEEQEELDTEVRICPN